GIGPCAPAPARAHANAPAPAHANAHASTPAHANAHAITPTPAVLCSGVYQCHLKNDNPTQAESFHGLPELLTEEGIQGNLSNQLWDSTFEMEILPRGGLYFNQIWAQWCLGVNESTYKTGRLKWAGDGYIFIDEDLWWSEFASEPEIEEQNAFVEVLKDLILADYSTGTELSPLGELNFK
ncbi:hypothetical protein O181_127537, partial [Austropuccinia psidii MF-1]|nr:hypothetical protein [Austropuccinia psidii MF-1]